MSCGTVRLGGLARRRDLAWCGSDGFVVVWFVVVWLGFWCGVVWCGVASGSGVWSVG